MRAIEAEQSRREHFLHGSRMKISRRHFKLRLDMPA